MKYFINEAFTFILNQYIQNNEKPQLQAHDNAQMRILKTLIFIYNEIDIVNPYKTNNEKGLGGFDENIIKYGYSRNELEKFKRDVLNFYNKEVELNKNIIKEINPYLEEVEKDLIDLYYCKCIAFATSRNDIEFKKYLFTTKNEDTTVQAYNLLYSKNIKTTETYLEKALHRLDYPITFKPLLTNKLDNSIYEYFGIAKTIVDTWNQQQINSVNEQILGYAKTSLDDPELLNKINALLISRKKPKIEIVY